MNRMRKPLLTREDLPVVSDRLRDFSSVFNPGAVRNEDEIVLVTRVQTRGRETLLWCARSNDGIIFRMDSAPIQLKGLERFGGMVYHVYDARVTRLDDAWYMLVAMDVDDGCRLGLVRSLDLQEFEFLAQTGEADTRNGVLFPRRSAFYGNRYLRLERPNRTQLGGGPRSGCEIVLAASDDLLRWETIATVAQGRPHYWDELIGPGPPPVLTQEGWLLVYHGVATHFAGVNIYQAGVMLLDAENPSLVLARGTQNILEPREPWELTGQVPNVVFPSGIVPLENIGDRPLRRRDEVLLYYGAADTCIGALRIGVDELLDACHM